MFENKIKISTKTLFVLVLSFLLTLISVAIISIIFGGPWNSYRVRLMQQNSILIFGLALALFLLFRRLNLGTVDWINRISATTFGIYLIHDNHFIRNWLWHTRIHVVKHFQHADFIIWSIFIIVCVFTVCSLIDWLKLKIFDNLINKAVSPLKPFDLKIKELFTPSSKKLKQ